MLIVYARGLIFIAKINIVIFQKEKGNTFTHLINFKVKSLQKEKIAQIYYYDPQSAEINVKSSQSESIPRRLTLVRRYRRSLLFSNDLHIYFSLY